MSMDQEPSPEEILLRLIKEGKSAKASPPKGQEPLRAEAFAPAPASEMPQIPSCVNKKMTFVLPWRSWSEKFYSDLHVLPKIFLLLSAILAVAIVAQIINDAVQSKRKLDRLWVHASRSESLPKAATSATPAANATPEGLPEKDLFKFAQGAGPVAEKAPARVASLESILSNYVLSGIIGGDKPQAVIEDKRQGKTFFVSEGETLGEMCIVKIEEGKVTVSVGGEQAQLEL